jgi:hypothetical protein
VHRRDAGQPVNPAKGEGAKVFRFNGHYWLIADVWKGPMVLRSGDALNWTEQPGYILGPELVYRDGKLLVDRDADLSFRLQAPSL